MAILKHSFLLVLAAGAGLSFGSPLFPHLDQRLDSRQSPSLNFTDYLYVYFTGERLPAGEQVYMAVSNDNDPGSWTTLNSGKPVLISDVGMKGIRDPSLIISPDRSKFYLINTDLKVYGLGWNNGTCFTCNGSKSIIVWESTDLVNWTGPSTPIVSRRKRE
ncbi:hypothetical protein MFIFM68171_07270 [Madurella fahalii]|uniref:Glycoside hydrolase family 43 protein n=1 Tax=Madurella fahalii TaxID=1157608 RepID=A0ABQ0GH19_9PEZI